MENYPKALENIIAAAYLTGAAEALKKSQELSKLDVQKNLDDIKTLRHKFLARAEEEGYKQPVHHIEKAKQDAYDLLVKHTKYPNKKNIPINLNYTHTSNTSHTNTNTPHTNTNTPHTNTPHTNTPHTNTPHTNTPHTNTNTPHTNTPHTNTPHTNTPYTNTNHTNTHNMNSINKKNEKLSNIHTPNIPTNFHVSSNSTISTTPQNPLPPVVQLGGKHRFTRRKL
jgi:hypothetical protein